MVTPHPIGPVGLVVGTAIMVGVGVTIIALCFLPGVLVKGGPQTR